MQRQCRVLPMLLLLCVLLPILLPTCRRKKRRSRRRKVLRSMKSDTTTTPGNVWQSLSGELHAFIRSRVPTTSDADDILQDVFVRVIEKTSSLRQSDRIESWVYQTARNAIVDFYRRRTPQPADSVEDVVAQYLENSNENLNHAVGAWLSAMTGKLPDKLRDAVRMYEVDGLSQLEIAKRLKISVSGAKSRVQRGRRELEVLLRGCCQLEIDTRGNVIGCTPMSHNCCTKVSCECSGKGS